MERELEEIRIYKRVFSSKDGEVILRDLIKKCGFFNGTFDPNHASMAFNEGRRSVVVDLINLLEIDVERMRKELITLQQEEKRFDY